MTSKEENMLEQIALQAEMKLAKAFDGEVGFPVHLAGAVADLIDAKVKLALQSILQSKEEGEGNA